MKILFLYKDPLHARPLRKCRKDFDAEGIELHAVHARNHEMCREFRRTIPADAWMVHQRLLCDELCDDGKPVIILERIDGAQLAAGREWLEHENVKALIKGYIFTPASLNNEVRGRHLVRVLIRHGVRAAKKSMLQEGRPSQLNPAVLTKIYAGFGFGFYDYLERCLGHSFNGKARPVDVSFMGTIAYSGSEVEAHRRAALQCVERWPGRSIASAGRCIQQNCYDKIVQESKVVLSPWGCGEACHRDYEAWVMGAVVVKPLTDWVDSFPDMYRPGETYVPCRPDFSDAHDVIRGIISNWPDYEGMRRKCRNMVLEGRRRDVMAARFANIFREVLP